MANVHYIQSMQPAVPHTHNITKGYLRWYVAREARKINEIIGVLNAHPCCGGPWLPPAAAAAAAAAAAGDPSAQTTASQPGGKRTRKKHRKRRKRRTRKRKIEKI